MTVVNIHEAKTHLSRLLEAVASGEEVIIAKAGRPVARLTGFTEGRIVQRRFGQDAGQFVVPDDFDDPLSPAVLLGADPFLLG